MSPELLVWLVTAALCLALATQPLWASRIDTVLWRWYLVGFPLAVLRVRVTWRKLCQTTDLAVARRPGDLLIGGDTLVKGSPLRPIPPSLGPILPTPNGFTARIRLHPGQTPAQVVALADHFAHAWRVHSVRVVSPERGHVVVVATAHDPLSDDSRALLPARRPRPMTARIGKAASGPWEIDFRQVPHWLIVGATRSGKSNWLAALVVELAPQQVALVGIDCKGGMELSIVAPRLSALAISRREAAQVLSALLVEAEGRMRQCRQAGARSIWELPDEERPVPVAVLVDEIAELYLTDGSRETKSEAAECSTSLLRLGQLGAALGIHLVIAGQRFGSELGHGATALRAQLGGRVCHRVHDEASAEMALGDLSPDAVCVAQQITEGEQGVAVTTVGGHWVRARSTLTTPAEARQAAEEHAHRAPTLKVLGHSATEGGEARE
ncbi:FtsK/SpoIIIE domain-containing protein [Streptomyces scopuliridis]|uniref:FtsK/SpoIIIE domain-containing protein n=1 Tax=Streptomyces scopuliridis TaxID=452529 RepID=UPI00369D6647